MSKKNYKKTSYSFKDENQILNFGLYEGEKIGDIMAKYPDYIDWCIDNFKGFKLWKKLNKKFQKNKNEKSNENR